MFKHTHTQISQYSKGSLCWCYGSLQYNSIGIKIWSECIEKYLKFSQPQLSPIEWKTAQIFHLIPLHCFRFAFPKYYSELYGHVRRRFWQKGVWFDVTFFPVLLRPNHTESDIRTDPLDSYVYRWPLRKFNVEWLISKLSIMKKYHWKLIQ